MSRHHLRVTPPKLLMPRIAQGLAGQSGGLREVLYGGAGAAERTAETPCGDKRRARRQATEVAR
eukprot:581483-Pyramimonas_sp.AAC.1